MAGVNAAQDGSWAVSFFARIKTAGDGTGSVPANPDAKTRKPKATRLRLSIPGKTVSSKAHVKV